MDLGRCGVICFFRAQVREVGRVAAEEGLFVSRAEGEAGDAEEGREMADGALQVATVDAFQGAERDVVLLSTATTRASRCGVPRDMALWSAWYGHTARPVPRRPRPQHVCVRRPAAERGTDARLAPPHRCRVLPGARRHVPRTARPATPGAGMPGRVLPPGGLPPAAGAAHVHAGRRRGGRRRLGRRLMRCPGSMPMLACMTYVSNLNSMSRHRLCPCA